MSRAPRRHPGRGWLGAAACALALLVVGGTAGCTFQERGNGGDDDGVEMRLDSLLADASDPAGAVLGVVRTFRDATASGDLALALALTDRDASFADELTGGLPEGSTRGELLLELRARLANGYRLREETADVVLGDGAAAVYSRLVLEAREGGLADGEAARQVHETVVLVPVGEGWRIRHLHRSIASEP